MTSVSRRMLLLGGASAMAASTANWPHLATADTRKRHPACGCVMLYPDEEFMRDCLTHDADGRRWDSYTGREIAALEGYEVFVCEEDGDCYCCGKGSMGGMPKGALMAGRMSGYYEPEWDEKCLDCLRAEWVNVQTTDWFGMAMQIDAEERAEQTHRIQKVSQ